MLKAGSLGHSLVMVGTDPRCSGNHGHNCDDHSDNTPCKDNFGRVSDNVVLEGPYDNEDEPSDS